MNGKSNGRQGTLELGVSRHTLSGVFRVLGVLEKNVETSLSLRVWGCWY